MLNELKDKLVCELKEVSKDGVKTGNIEYITKLAETYKNLNKADKEELESIMYRDRMNPRFEDDGRYGEGRYPDGRYPTMYYGANDGRGRGSQANRDMRGRYADGIRPVEEFYDHYMGAKHRYRTSGSRPHEMIDGLEMFMKHLSLLLEDLYKECDSEEERRVMDKYIKHIGDIH